MIVNNLITVKICTILIRLIITKSNVVMHEHNSRMVVSLFIKLFENSLRKSVINLEKEEREREKRNFNDFIHNCTGYLITGSASLIRIKDGREVG